MSDIQAHLSDGTILQFPAGTTDDVVNSTVKSHLAMDNPNDPLAGIENPVNDALAKGFSFAATAATKAAGGLGDLITKGPQGMLRNALFPEVAEAERNVGAQPAPGSALAQKALDAGGYEFKPESGGSSIGLSAATGAAAGAPFGPAGMAIGGAGGALSEGANQMGLPRYAQVAAGLAPAFLGKPASMAGNLFRKPETQAASLIRGRLESDAAAGGPSPQSMGTDLANSNGVPLTLADVGGEGVKGLAEKVATQPGEARQVASQFLNDRDAAAGPRLVKALDDNISNGGDAFTTAKALGQQRAQAAAPLYEKAMSAEGLTSPRLEKLLADPIMQQGFQRGIEIQRLDALAKGQPFNPNDYTMSFGAKPANEGFYPAATTGREMAPGHMLEAADAPTATPIPNMKTLDAVKRGLDDVLEQYRDPTTGRLQLDQRGKAINDVRVAFVNEMDKLNPDYAAARQAWAGPSQSMDAMKQGQNFQNMRPEMIADQIKNMTDGEKQFFKLGAADTLRQNVAKTSSGGNEALRIVGNNYVKQQLRPLFSTEEAYNKFIGAAQNENRMFQTRQQMLGNSRTAARLAEAQASEGSGFMGPAVQGAMGLISHEPVLGIGALLRGAGNAYQKLAGPSPATNAAAARMLFNPAISQQQLQQIISSRLGQRFPLSPGLTATSMLNPPANNGPLAGQ